MDFEVEYKKIKESVKDDLNYLEQEIKNLFVNSGPLDKDLTNFLTSPAKRLRPLLGLLFSRCISNKINQNQYNLLLAVELIHNATLIHDDVIDKADERRKQKTFNAKFDDNLAVIAGDFLLSTAMDKIIETGSLEVLKNCAAALKSTCIGEISQYFTKFKITSIDEYIKKSKEKTALLFELAVVGSLLLDENRPSNDLINIAREFSQNFGIAFQIRDDLINVINSKSLSNYDVKAGIYTAPVIFAYNENKNILSEQNILQSIDANRGIEKTTDLMNNYFDKATAAVQKLDDSPCQSTIVKLNSLLKEKSYVERSV